MQRTFIPPSALQIALLLLFAAVAALSQGVAPTPPPGALPAPRHSGEATAPSNPAPKEPAGAPALDSAAELTMVLGEMDESSQHFKNAQADVELIQYTAVVKESDTQSGQIFFRRRGAQTDVSLWIEKPHPKRAVVKDDKLTFFDPRTRQVTQRNLGTNKADVEAVMNLGFGSRGKELLKDYDTTFMAWETIDGTRTARLELVAKSEKLRQLFTKVVLWIDPHRDVALQQQRFESSGDYQLTHYTNIKLSGHIEDEKFVIEK
jgi:outer membrane lipoprotein-sorting protein